MHCRSGIPSSLPSGVVAQSRPAWWVFPARALAYGHRTCSQRLLYAPAPSMRFFEYESRAIVAKAGIPVTKHGFAKTSEEARRIAEGIDGPVVIKSQVLTGGRMKAGGVQFADTPEDAERHAEHVLDLEIG